jgi:hypothetical protein
MVLQQAVRLDDGRVAPRTSAAVNLPVTRHADRQ